MKTNFGKNSAVTIFYQILAVLNGFIIPRMMIAVYGSPINGSIATINQIAGFLGIMELGMGGVASFAFYKAFTNADGYDLTTVKNTVSNYYKKIALISVGISVFLSVVLPFLLNNGQDILFNFELVVIISVSYFITYYFGVTSQLLLAADYKLYISTVAQIFVLVLQFGTSVILINNGVDVRILKLVCALIAFIRPLFLHIYVKKHYKFSGTKERNTNLIKNRWNNFGQSVAFYIHNQTDMLIIMLFLVISESSVYSLYAMVVTAIKTVITSIMKNCEPVMGRVSSSNGVTGEESRRALDRFTVLNTLLLNTLFPVTFALIIPFMKMYTAGADYDYIRPAFAYIFCMAEYFYLMRTPFNSFANANGFFKETQASAFGEVGINILLSLLLVKPFGIAGIVVATGLAELFRFIYYYIYVNKNVLGRSLLKEAKLLLITAINGGLTFALIKAVQICGVDTIFKFVIAGLVSVTAFALIQLALIYILYRDAAKEAVRSITSRFKR